MSDETSATLRLFAEYANDILVRVNEDGRVVYVSPSVRQLGYLPEHLIGETGLDLFHPDDRDRVALNIQGLLRGERPEARNLRHRVRTSKGEWIWVETNPRPLFDADGKPTGFLNIFRDVTQDQLTSAAAFEQQSLFRAAFMESAIGKVVLDREGRIVMVNRALSEVLFYPEAELVGRTDNDFAHPDEVDTFTAQFVAALNGDINSYRIKRRYLRRDGVWVWFSLIVSMSRDLDGEAHFIVAELEDLTERNAAEAELRLRQAQAEESVVAKSQFLANMSHEIRTPLTGVIGFADLLESLEGLPPEAARYAGRIALSAKALLAIVNDVLDFSKLESAAIDLDLQPFDLAAFMEESIDLVRDQAAAKHLALNLRLGPMPASPLVADGIRLRQVLLNLLTNAVKFTSSGSVTVQAELAETGGKLKVAVSDTGPGVPADQVDRLFQRFSQLDGSNTREHGGVGLGLAISKGLVELMGGEIGLRARPGGGSTFWFTVGVNSAGQSPPVASPEVAEGGDLGPLRLLVVDDVLMNRELVKAMLEPFDIIIEEASDGLEAVAAAMRTPFDLIFMDLQMPVMDGLSATAAIRAESDLNRATPIVAISANVLPQHVAACLEVGMNDHIAKPILPEDLIGKLARWTSDHVALAS